MSTTKVSSVPTGVLVNSDRLSALQMVMDGNDPGYEPGIGEFAIFLKDRRCWIIEDSKLVQGSKVYCQYLPGDTFSIVILPGESRNKIAIEYRKNQEVLWRGRDRNPEAFEPQGFFVLLAGGAGVSLNNCVWLENAKDPTPSATTKVDWRDREMCDFKYASDNSSVVTRSKKVTEDTSVRSHIMAGTCPIVADIESNNEIVGLQFLLADGMYGEKTHVLAGMVPSTANVSELSFPKFVNGNFEPTCKIIMMKNGEEKGCCSIS